MLAAAEKGWVGGGNTQAIPLGALVFWYGNPRAAAPVVPTPCNHPVVSHPRVCVCGDRCSPHIRTAL